MEQSFKIRCFGVAREITGEKQVSITMEEGTSVAELKNALFSAFPAFQSIDSLRIAVNEAYSNDEDVLSTTDDIVLIPPVSGG